MKDLRIDLELSYSEFEQYDKYEINEYGKELIGQHFITLDDYNDGIASFILIATKGDDYIYKCIYLYNI